MKKIGLLILTLCFAVFMHAQDRITSRTKSIDYLNPTEYEIGGVQISGIQYLDPNVLVHLTGLQVGDIIMIPGDEITKAVNKLWDQGLFSEVKISLEKVINNKAFIDIYLQERPRLSKYTFSGIKKSEVDDIKEKVKLVRGSQVTENTIITTKSVATKYFIDKGFYNVEVDIEQEPDTSLVNHVILKIKINKNNRIKINEIYFSGNDTIGYEKKWYNKHRDPDKLAESRLKRAMKDTKKKRWYSVFKTSKFVENKFEEDKENIIAKYHELGFRDAHIVYDSIARHDDKTINLYIGIDEGKKYYFRDISWIGNTKYPSEVLSQVLGIKKGDVYNQKLLDEKLLYDPQSVFSLYQDNGYLFSNISPVEIYAENDSLDIQMRVYEGKQARINRVSIAGNTRTNDRVVMREVRTVPGSLYKRSEVQRTIREFAQLGYFDPEKLNVDFNPDPAKGTVDLEYIVEEKPSDQIELSGGWGAGMIVGTLGVSFNNFSLKNIFNPKAYRPLPSGDGQRLSLRAQASGLWFQNYSFMFVEPWLGGNKPNSLTTSVYHSIMTNGAREPEERTSFNVTGAGLGLGKRLEWPDDYFTLYNELSYRFYDINNYTGFLYKQGQSNNFSFKTALSRHSSGPNPIFPTTGSSFSVSVELTPPYSLFSNKDYSTIPSTEKYKWIEYHKWKFSGSWFTTLVGSKSGDSRALVLLTKFEAGILGHYNSKLGPSPFEGFQLGGDGLYGYNLYGRETIGLRGYTNNSLTPNDGGNVYDKFTVELRYPLSLNPTATLYAIVFAEAGNAWFDVKKFDPFDVKKSAGVGVRIYMPMIGMLGVDWGYGFDEIKGVTGANGSQFHFVIGQTF
ncbi:MAG: outer membrane protein assembly factor BamA [Bacteroidales bacterium]|nr:outer membrane protein assembly factor BamA [Bacteroidales bacterium]